MPPFKKLDPTPTAFHPQNALSLARLARRPPSARVSIPDHEMGVYIAELENVSSE